MPLDELHNRLLDRRAGDDLKNAAWSWLVRQARTAGGDWVVAAAGVMLPGLRRIASRLTRGLCAYRHDLHSEIVVGFLEVLRSVDLRAPRPYGVLWWSAYRRGWAARASEQNASGCRLLDTEEFRGRRVTPVKGHPDFVLADAVKAGVFTGRDAELISCTRLQRQALGAAARRIGMSYAACQQRRLRADHRLAGYLGQSPAPTTLPAAA